MGNVGQGNRHILYILLRALQKILIIFFIFLRLKTLFWETLCAADGNAQWHNCCGNWDGSSSTTQIETSRPSQDSTSGYTPRRTVSRNSKWIFVHSRSLQRYSQEPKGESTPSVLWCLSGSTKWDVHRTEENGMYTERWEGRQAAIWTNLENIMLNEINQPQKYKCYMIPYMEFLESSHLETLRYQNILPQNMPLWQWDLLNLKATENQQMQGKLQKQKTNFPPVKEICISKGNFHL